MKSNSTNKVTISGYKPKVWQSDLHKLLKNSRNSGMRVTVLSPRQVGKSYGLQFEIIRFSLEAPSVIMYLCPTNNLARKCFKDLSKKLIKSGLIKSANSTTLEIEWVNGSQVLFRSAEMRDNLRGYTVDFLIIDEAAFISDEIFDIVLPMTNVKQAPIVIVSTPRFRTGKFYEWYQYGMNNLKNFYSLTWSSYDTSEFLTDELKEEYKQTMTKQKFQNEILGEFTDDDGSLFNNIAECIYTGKVEYNSLFIGVDWATGTGRDYTVVTAINENGEMVFIKYFNDKTPTDQVNELTKIFNEKKQYIKLVQVEQNSIGNVFYDMLVKQNPNIRIIKFLTTNKSKSRLVNQLQTALENEKIKLIKDDKLLNELRVYESTYNSKTGTISYNAPSGYNDDTVISLMLAWDSLIGNKGHYKIVIK